MAVKTQSSNVPDANSENTGTASPQTNAQHSNPMTDAEWEAWLEQDRKDFQAAARRAIAMDLSRRQSVSPEASRFRHTS